jgi:hypothetical protein
MSRTDALVESHQARQDAQHQAGIDAADARADALEDYIEQVVADTLKNGGDLMLPILESEGKPAPIRQLLDSLEATHLSDWLRLIGCAPIAERDIVALNMAGWMEQTLRESADVQAEAERLMALDDADAADRVAEEPTWFRL